MFFQHYKETYLLSSVQGLLMSIWPDKLDIFWVEQGKGKDQDGSTT